MHLSENNLVESKALDKQSLVLNWLETYLL